MRRDIFLMLLAVVWTAGCGGQTESRRPSEIETNAEGSAEPVDEHEATPSCDIASTPCDGTVVGTWSVVDCPLALTGQVDLRAFGLGCLGATITSSSLGVSGTWTANASGTFRDDTTTQGTQEFELSPDCLSVGVLPGSCTGFAAIGNALGYDTLACVDAGSGGCTCTGTFDQQGGLAAISPHPLPAGRYSATGSLLATTGITMDGGRSEATYEHCAMDDAMVLTLPVSGQLGLLTGSIVLRRR
jgi:hypothetical protein